MPSFILIHATVWPQYTNVTDRTDRTGYVAVIICIRPTFRIESGLGFVVNLVFRAFISDSRITMPIICAAG